MKGLVDLRQIPSAARKFWFTIETDAQLLELKVYKDKETNEPDALNRSLRPNPSPTLMRSLCEERKEIASNLVPT